MPNPVAVRIESPAQYIEVTSHNREQGFKPFEIGIRYRQGYLSVEDRYLFIHDNYADNYSLISFEDFLRMEAVSC